MKIKIKCTLFFQIDPESTTDPLPDVDNFQHLVPLEPPPPSPLHKSHTFGYSTSVYKATDIKTGLHVCLRRIHSFRLVNTKCMILVDQWKKLHHSNLVMQLIIYVITFVSTFIDFNLRPPRLES